MERMDMTGVWIPASAGDPYRFGEVLGDDGRGWSLTLVVPEQLDRAKRAGGFIASNDAEQYLIRR